MYIANGLPLSTFLLPALKMTQSLKKILIIDDEPGIRKSIGIFCESIGYQVQLGASLTDAKNYLQKEKFEVLVVDYQLPDGFGLDLYYELENNSDINCFILMTGEYLENIPIRQNLNNRLHVLLKPFDIDKFLHIITS